MGSRLDHIYRSLLHTKFFTHGWGKPENLRKIFEFRKILSRRETCMQLVESDYPITITKEIDNGDHYQLEAEFISPLVKYLPNLLPKESEKAYFQMILPKKWASNLKPTCLHLAGTGDHGFWMRRMLMGKPLYQTAGIASIIHENPFYGLRKPQDQIRSSLRNVSDLFLMGGCLVLESLAIFHWAERQGLGPLGVTGISMGGHMASLAACSWNKPIALVPCLSWSTASGVFTQGVLSGAINWEKLKNQYFSDEIFRDELFNMIQSPEGHFRVYHEVGLQFARDFPSSLKHVEKLKNEAVNQIDQSKMHHVSTSSQPVKSVKSKNLLNHLKILNNFKSKKQENVDNLQLKYKQSQSNISKPQLTHPTGIRPTSAKDTPPVEFKPYVTVKDSLTWEAVQFMRGIMDECTHLGNFTMPFDPSLAIIVAAEDDAYMPRDGIIPLTKLWPGSELRILQKGHITAFLFNQQVFRQAIIDAFSRTTEKYYSNSTHLSSAVGGEFYNSHVKKVPEFPSQL